MKLINLLSDKSPSALAGQKDVPNVFKNKVPKNKKLRKLNKGFYGGVDC